MKQANFRVAIFLKKRLDLAPGDAVHLCLGNNNMVHPTCLGIWALGAVTSIGDVNLEAPAIASQLEDIKARAAFCTPETAELMKAAVDACHNPESIALFWLVCLEVL